MAGGADAIGGFLIALKDSLEAQRRETLDAREAHAETRAKLEQTISKLKVSEAEKNELKEQVAELTAPTPVPAAPTNFGFASESLEKLLKSVTTPNLQIPAMSPTLQSAIDRLRVSTSSLDTLNSINRSTDALEALKRFTPIVVTCLQGHSWHLAVPALKPIVKCPQCGLPAI